MPLEPPSPSGAEQVLHAPAGKGVFEPELQVVIERYLGNNGFDEHLPRDHVEFADQHVPDSVVIAGGGKNDQGVRDFVGHNADDFLEELRLAFFGLNQHAAGPAPA